MLDSSSDVCFSFCC